MSKRYEEFAYMLAESLAPEDAIFRICDFLKEYIAFSAIVCTNNNKNTEKTTVFMHYSVTVDTRKAVFPIIKVSEETFVKLFGENFDKVLCANSAAEHEILIDSIESDFFNYESILSINLYCSENKGEKIFFSLHSSHKKAFTEKDIEILGLFRPLIQKIIVPFYFKNPEAQFNLTSTGPLPITFENLLRQCPNLKDIMSSVDAVAPYNSTILIEGPTGSGKELIAETIQSLSTRYNKAFVRVNCGAIPESLLESELFGFEKGAFTGAVQSRKGYFEQANYGTIYLDEIGELSKNAQVRLLRVLEYKEIQRIGSEQRIKLDIRIICATNRNLYNMVKQGEFREDLFYRLNIFPIKIPSLIERKKDLPILINYFFNFYAKQFNLSEVPHLSYKNYHFLMDYRWEGNVRQLRYSIERAILLNIAIKRKDLDFSFLDEYSTTKKKKVKLTPVDIENALRESRGKIQGKGGAADILKIHPATLRSRMQVLEIPFNKKDLIKYSEG